MPPCQRCGLGKRSGNGRGWCSNQACREAERKEKEEQQAAKRQRQLAREDQGAGRRGPRASESALVEQEAKRLRQEEREEQAAGRRGPRASESALVEQEAKRLRQEERAEKGAGERGPCPGEGAGGRPMDTEEARAEKLEVVRGPPFFGDDNFEAVKESYKKFLRAWGPLWPVQDLRGMLHADSREVLLPVQNNAETGLQELPGEEDQLQVAIFAPHPTDLGRPILSGAPAAGHGQGGPDAD